MVDTRISEELVQSIRDDAKLMRECFRVVNEESLRLTELLRKWYGTMSRMGPVPNDLIVATKKELGIK